MSSFTTIRPDGSQIPQLLCPNYRAGRSRTHSPSPATTSPSKAPHSSATSPRPRLANGKKGSTPKPHLYPTPCTWCLSADKVQRFGYLSAYCSKNPSRLPNPSLLSSTSATPSNTSQRLRALISQLDHADTPDASNAAMHLIAVAAIEASDYLDSA